MTLTQSYSDVYQGQFGEFTLTKADFWSVKVYRGGLAIAALCFAIATGLILWQGGNPDTVTWLTPLFAVFAIALGISLATIHIYLKPLHQALQAFWLVGVVSALFLEITSAQPLATYVYSSPPTLLGIGFLFAALTGIFFKEGFCFNRLETRLLTPIVPTLLLGHMFGILPLNIEKGLLGLWALLFVIFALRKLFQPMPDDIGDKSVFEHLKQH